MKIFGKKRKSTGGEGDADTTSSTAKSLSDQQEDVPSYFGSTNDAPPTKANKPSASKKPNGDDIDALLAMDPSKLNSKQRRLVRRHEERSGKSQNQTETNKKTETIETCVADEDEGTSGASSSEQLGVTDSVGRDDNAANETVEKDVSKDSEEPMAVLETSEILKKLDGLNSKERRKLLRQLKRQGIDESVVLAAEEQAKKVASRNEKESAAAPNQVNTEKARSKRRPDDSPQPEAAESDSKPKRRRRRGRKVDLDSLTPEERARREEQRRMQIEAAERRAKGLVDPNRPPLNSERRRANRRKPGPSAIIAMQKREQARQRGKFNAYGYHMRKGGFDQPEE